MKDEGPLLCQALADPGRTPGYSPRQWEALVIEGRVSGLLAKLHFVLEDAGRLDDVPDGPRMHLDSARLLADEQHIALNHELTQLGQLLRPLGCPLVLLKGAAYVRTGMKAAGGRRFSDIDILVPKDRLSEVEALLMRHGWVSGHRDAYDQRYYRQWMHEIPPMQHIRRGTTLDIHHAITPSTSRIRADSLRMLADASPATAGDAWYALAPLDRVLHSATHLFLESEFHNGLRDLADLHTLLGELHATTPDFMNALHARAAETGLRRPLHYALRYVRAFFGAQALPFGADLARDAPPAWIGHLMDACFRQAFTPYSPLRPSSAWREPGLFALYVRGHWLRMPAHLLAYHLTRKAIMTRLEKSRDNRNSDQNTTHDA
ncbi:nucleotidyltransferase domain-containing protein [Methyloversatilis thermotolerans]|uniref:nucleotidyltransferase domain-containing protein n=1 Tax=Methyloversatilis thermotolerans TaxID=1346290 RepID=UPI00035E9957|nr:nucleotidyltransferase family protein [Methyloversatilis thermotolerans]